jgi:hypothetical protein
MQLNLPILDQLVNSQNILIAGAGGGFDVFSGLPLYFTLQAMGKNVHLANYSFTEPRLAALVSQTVTLLEDRVVGAQGGVHMNLSYLPEPYLAQWFKEARGEEVTVWMFDNPAAAPLAEAYRALVKHLNIDAMILVDGGVDSLMRGDEYGSGSLVEDSVTLSAVSTLEVPVKILACLGFGSEVEEGVCHYNALENMAALMKEGAFYGSCALTPQMEVFQLYEAACRYVFEKPDHHKSHISTRVIPAVKGEFGNFHMYDYYRHIPILVTPLMSLYWFFDAHAVSRRSLLVEALRNTWTKEDTIIITRMITEGLNLRPRRAITY